MAFLVLKWQALGACDEYYILLEENNFTDLTFGEKENSEQGPQFVQNKQVMHLHLNVLVLFSNHTG